MRWRRVIPVVLLLAAVAQAKAMRISASEAAFNAATAMRAELEAKPAGARGRADYEAVLNAYRAVYHRWPAAGKAPAAVEAVAELLAEGGGGSERQKQHDLEAARGQFTFLLTQYPKSPEVAEALLNEGELCANTLHDAGCAEENLRAVMRRFPDSSYAEQAALDLKPELDLKPTQASRAQGLAGGVAESMAEPKLLQGSQGSQESNLQRVTRSASTESARTQTVDTTHTADTNQAAHAALATGAPKRQTASDGPAQSEAPQALPASTATASPSAAASVPTRRVHGGVASGRTVEITGIRHWSNPVSTRIAIDLSGEVEYEAARVAHPDRIFFDLHGARLARGLNGREVQVIDDGYLKRIRAAQYKPDVTRVVLDVTDVSDYSAFLLPNPWRLILDIHGGRGGGLETAQESEPAQNTLADVAALSRAPSRVEATTGPTSAPVAARVASVGAVAHAHPGRHARVSADALPKDSTPAVMAQAAQPTADGERSLVRALGLKVNRIVIDAGHGGHDSGTLGPGGIEEKDVVLDVALRTGKLLEQRLGAEVIYTRDDDTFVPLETRTAIANKAQADLFLSIHANSSPEAEARGVETYYLNFTSDPQALEVAARENAVSNAGVHQLSDLVRKIALKDKIDESREFAADVDESLYHGLSHGDGTFRDRGVKKAPFVVLIGAQMPSVLAEISFLTNPEDARLLRQSAWRERIAESLADGVERYLNGLSQVRPGMVARRNNEQGQ